MSSGHHHTQDEIGDNILDIFKLIAKFPLTPMRSIFHSVALRTTCLWKRKPVPNRSHGSSTNPDPTASLASGGLGLTPRGPNPAEPGRGLCCCRGWGTAVTPGLLRSGSTGLGNWMPALASEQPGTRSICWLKGEDHHLQIQGRVKEKWPERYFSPIS